MMRTRRWYLTWMTRVRVEERRVRREHLTLVETWIRYRYAGWQRHWQHRWRRVIRSRRRRGRWTLASSLRCATLLRQDTGHRPRGDPRVRYLRWEILIDTLTYYCVIQLLIIYRLNTKMNTFTDTLRFILNIIYIRL